LAPKKVSLDVDAQECSVADIGRPERVEQLVVRMVGSCSPDYLVNDPFALAPPLNRFVQSPLTLKHGDSDTLAGVFLDPQARQIIIGAASCRSGHRSAYAAGNVHFAQRRVCQMIQMLQALVADALRPRGPSASTQKDALHCI